MSENQICINFKYLLGDSFNKVTEKEKKKDREGGKEGKGKTASPGNKHIQTRNPHFWGKHFWNLQSLYLYPNAFSSELLGEATESHQHYTTT